MSGFWSKLPLFQLGEFRNLPSLPTPSYVRPICCRFCSCSVPVELAIRIVLSMSSWLTTPIICPPCHLQLLLVMPYWKRKMTRSTEMSSSKNTGAFVFFHWGSVQVLEGVLTFAKILLIITIRHASNISWLEFS